MVAVAVNDSSIQNQADTTSRSGSSWIRRRRIQADALEAGKTRQALAGQSVVAISHQAAHRRRIGALRVGESGPRRNCLPSASLSTSAPSMPAYFPFTGDVRNNARFRVFVQLVLDQIVAATDPVKRSTPMQHQAFATAGGYPAASARRVRLAFARRNWATGCNQEMPVAGSSVRIRRTRVSNVPLIGQAGRRP